MAIRNDQPKKVAELLQHARLERARLTDLLSHYRPYLRYLASHDKRLRLLRHKLDASDIVQSALRRANQSFETFRGHDEPQFTSWMVTVLEHTVLDAIRYFRARPRDVAREMSLHRMTGSARIMFNDPEADGTAASHRAIQGDYALVLANALAELPRNQEAAVRMHFLEGLSLKAIAANLGKSDAATAGLLKRGMQSLRESLPRDFPDGL